MGDLNYRLELPNGHSLDNSEVRRICTIGEHTKLLKYDQVCGYLWCKIDAHLTYS